MIENNNFLQFEREIMQKIFENEEQSEFSPILFCQFAFQTKFYLLFCAF
jgi:hypothetical protein